MSRVPSPGLEVSSSPTAGRSPCASSARAGTWGSDGGRVLRRRPPRPPHVARADEAVRLGRARRESYVDALIAAAEDGARGAPGLRVPGGEPGFARACVEAGLTFVGRSRGDRGDGSKTGAGARMEAAGVPVVPGMMRPAADAGGDRRARGAGYPLLLKASAGGGGKGMRRIEREAERGAFERASAEAEALFGDGAVYAERLVEGRATSRCRSSGISGTILAVGERECSIQRRHQKVVEECPRRRSVRRCARGSAPRRPSRGGRRLRFLRHRRVPPRARTARSTSSR